METVEEEAKPEYPAAEPGGAKQNKGRADAADNTGGSDRRKRCNREAENPKATVESQNHQR